MIFDTRAKEVQNAASSDLAGLCPHTWLQLQRQIKPRTDLGLGGEWDQLCAGVKGLHKVHDNQARRGWREAGTGKPREPPPLSPAPSKPTAKSQPDPLRQGQALSAKPFLTPGFVA